LQVDQFIIEVDKALRTLSGVVSARRPVPEPDVLSQNALSEQDKKHAAGLMRVNHVGEICAQALYQAQRVTSATPHIREQLAKAAIEEEDHLYWCAKRLEDLGSRPSLLNPLWYGGSFAIGVIAGLAGDAWNLGFVAETEKQVELHLDSHLNSLPEDDFESRAIVSQMRSEEIAHGNMAKNAGAKELPEVAKNIMANVSKVMTKVAYHI
jgi:3-demethoxyubiquinol 3-hydroxylase